MRHQGVILDAIEILEWANGDDPEPMDGLVIRDILTALQALDSLARALGMFVERTQNVNEDYESLVDKIERKRALKKEENQ